MIVVDADLTELAAMLAVHGVDLADELEAFRAEHGFDACVEVIDPDEDARYAAHRCQSGDCPTLLTKHVRATWLGLDGKDVSDGQADS